MSKTLQIILLAAVIIVIGVILFKDNNKASDDAQVWKLKLNTNPDPSEFGPSYWAGFHGLADKIPCGTCRDFAQKFMVFFHDVVNQKIGKPLYNPDNYQYFLNLISSVKAGTTTFSCI